MKFFAFLITVCAAFSAYAEYTLEQVSPHFSTDIQIVWQASMQQLPKNFWIYRKLPRVFPATTISNAIILASLQTKGFPKPSTNRITVWADHVEGEPQPPYFALTPETGEMSYSLGDRASDSPTEYLTDGAAVERAWACLAQLGVDRTEFAKTNIAEEGEWGVFLPRQIDGIQVYHECQGFSFQQYGSNRTVRSFWLALPNLERIGKSPPANTNQIIACIVAHKTQLVPPKSEEFKYFEKLKLLSTATKLTIVKITPYYGDSIYGERPTNGEPAKVICAVAELDAIADFGGMSNVNVRLLSPILSSEANRLLITK